MKNILERISIIFLILCIVLGAVVIIGQIIGLLLQRGDLMVLMKDLFVKPACVCGAISGMASYIMSKLSKEPANDSE